MKTELYTTFSLRALTLVLAAGFILLAAARVPAQEHSVTVGAAEFQRMVYSAHLLTQLDEKPELDASLQVLLELHRRNPHADLTALAGLVQQITARYRTNAPAYIRANGFRDEILAAYLDILRQAPAYTNFVPANLALLNGFMTSPDDYTTASPAELIHSANKRLLTSEGLATKRQRLLDACTARAGDNHAFAAALDLLLLPETLVSCSDTPAKIIGNTGSPLCDNLTMQTLLQLSLTNGDGNLTVSSNQLMTLFTNETGILWNAVHTNLALRAEVNQSQPDWLAYLTNQAAIDANAQRAAAVKQGQAPKIASATAAILVQSKLLEAGDPGRKLPEEMEGVASAMSSLAKGLNIITSDKIGGVTKIMASGDLLSAGMQVFNLMSGVESPEDRVVREIDQIKTLIGDLSTNMNYRFDRVDQSLTQIFETLNTNFNRIVIDLEAQHGAIAHLDANVDEIRRSLVGVQTDLNRLERHLASYVNQLYNRGLNEAFNTYLGYEAAHPGQILTADHFNYDAEPKFYTLADNSVDQLSCPFSGRDYTPAGLYAELMEAGGGTTNRLDQNIGYIKQYLSSVLGQQTAGTLGLGTPHPVANPRDWFVGAYAYAQLSTENPLFFRQVTPTLRLDHITARGRDLSEFFRSLTFSETTVNSNLYLALENQYVQRLVGFNAQISAVEGEYASSTNFALNNWRQWDSAAPRITANTTTVAVAATVADSIADWSSTGVVGQNGWSYGYYDRSVDANGAYDQADFVPFPHDGQGYSGTNFWNGHSYDWYAGNPPWDEIHQEWAHPNSNNGAAVIPGDHGTHEHWIVRRWESTVDGDLKCRFRFRKLNLGCGDGVIGMVCQNGSMVYSNAIAANDGIGRDDVIDLPGVRLGHKVDVVLAPGSRDYCDGSAFSAAMYLGEPTTNRWLASPRVRTHIAAGTTHSLALKADGTVVGWGGNWQGQSSIPASATNVVAVAAGNDQSVALKADGTVIGWGQATTPAGLNDVVAIASGGWHNLALKADGSVVGWGNNSDGEINVPGTAANVVAISAGLKHSLALKRDGTVVGWGAGGPGTSWHEPNYGQTIIPAGLSNVVAIAAGGYYSLALKADGKIVFWGHSQHLQDYIPASATNVVALSAGEYHILGLRGDGTVVGWGGDFYGETTIPPGLNNVVAIAAGQLHSLVLKRDGAVVVWGDNRNGQTARPPTVLDLAAWGEYAAGRWDVPSSLSPIEAVTAGSGHNLALTASGSVLGWGLNTWGQTDIPSVVQSGIWAVAAGLGHNLALATNGSVQAWGLNDFGQAFVPPLAQSGVVSISAGGKHSLALRTDGTVVPWGLNGSGQATVPNAVQGKVVAISAGGEHSLALTAAGAVVAWGGNSSGQTNVPSEALNDVVAIAAGRYHNLALKTNGKVVAWGLKSSGQCNVPASAESGVVAIAAGITHSVALKADGTALVWGSGPAAFKPPQSWNGMAAISVGDQHSVILRANPSSGADGVQAVSFVRAQIPVRVALLLRAGNDYVSAESGRAGPLNTAATELSGAKALLTAVLELGMPYTLERDDVLHGFLYGSESLADLEASRVFFQAENSKLQARPDAAPQALAEVAVLRYQRFADHLARCLNNLAATGQPEIPRLVGHTLCLLNLLRDAWTQPTNSPPPTLEMCREADTIALVLYGEPYAHYALQYSDNLSAPAWTATTITNLHNEHFINPPFSGVSHRFYRGVLLPAP